VPKSKRLKKRKPLAGAGCNSAGKPTGAGRGTRLNRNPKLAARVERAVLRAGETARRTAQMYGTPLYVCENGKVVAKRP
jgi:hypothetical protein